QAQRGADGLGGRGAGRLGRANAAAGVPDRRRASSDRVLQGSAATDGGPAASGRTVGVAVDRGLLARGGLREAAGCRAVQRREGAAGVVGADAAGGAGGGGRRGGGGWVRRARRGESG